MMLLHVDQSRALEYLSSCIDQVISFGDILQLIIVELIYKVLLSILFGIELEKCFAVRFYWSERRMKFETF